MAPEVILTEDSDAVYTCKADIWSIGITAIEVAEKNPPLSDIHPMRALKLIPTSDLGLSKPKNFSKLFVSFINVCLTKDPRKRPSATELLRDPFMQKGKDAPRQQILKQLVDKMADIRAKKKAGVEVTHDEDEEERQQEVPQIAVNAAVSYATTSRQNPGMTFEYSVSSMPSFGGFFSAHPAELRAISIGEFPPLVNKVKDKSFEVFDPSPLLAVNQEVYSTAMLDGRYLLMGTERGLFFVDINNETKAPAPIFQNIRFRQLQILSQFNILIALSGKREQIRQYKLSSIRKLICYLTGDDPSVLAQKKMDQPIGSAESDGASSASLDDEYRNARSIYNQGEETLVRKWSGDYFKIVGTKESKSFLIEETELTCYLVVLFKQDMVLFEWAKKPYNRFMKLKAFWLPETPKFMSLAQDGLTMKGIYLGYLNELNLVGVDDSKVKEIPVSKEFLNRSGSKDQWKSFVQIPFAEQKLADFIKSNLKSLAQVNQKVAAAVGGHVLSPDAVHLDRYFLGTFNRMTRVVDSLGQPMAGPGVGGWKDGVMWNESPTEIILRPLQHVIAVGLNTVEIVDWKTADLRQRLYVDSSAILRVISIDHNGTVLSIEKKRKGAALYLMRERSAPPRPSGSLLAYLKDSAQLEGLNVQKLSLNELGAESATDGTNERPNSAGSNIFKHAHQSVARSTELAASGKSRLVSSPTGSAEHENDIYNDFPTLDAPANATEPITDRPPIRPRPYRSHSASSYNQRQVMPGSNTTFSAGLPEGVARQEHVRPSSGVAMLPPAGYIPRSGHPQVRQSIDPRYRPPAMRPHPGYRPDPARIGPVRPMYDQNGRPIFDPTGRPMYLDAHARPQVFLDMNGRPIMRPDRRIIPDPRMLSLSLQSGRPIDPRMAHGPPMYDPRHGQPMRPMNRPVDPRFMRPHSGSFLGPPGSYPAPPRAGYQGPMYGRPGAPGGNSGGNHRPTSPSE